MAAGIPSIEQLAFHLAQVEHEIEAQAGVVGRIEEYTRHPEILEPVPQPHRQDFSDGIAVSEHLFSQAAGEQERLGILQHGAGLAFPHGKREAL